MYHSHGVPLMAEFDYVARDCQLRRFEGRLAAVDKDEALKALQGKGLLVFHLESVRWNLDDYWPACGALAFLATLALTMAICSVAVLDSVPAEPIARDLKLLSFTAAIIGVATRLFAIRRPTRPNPLAVYKAPWLPPSNRLHPPFPAGR